MNAALEVIARTQPALAAELAAGWELPLSAFSARLWEPVDAPGFEPAFREALQAELAGAVPDADALVSAVERAGAALTPHHLCPTNGPTFGAIDVVAAAAAPGPILVLAWSGVPMSNTAASGALCFQEGQYERLLRPGTPELARQRQAAKDRERDGVTERRIVLVPPELRDALVYECALPARVGEVRAAATPELAALLPEPRADERYPAWCARVCQGIERRLVGRQDVHYVDLNRVAARYLAAVLADPRHPVTRLAAAGVEVGGMSWTYARRPGKRESVETHTRPVERLREGLADGSLCPGLVPVFGALRLCSRIRLLGGFRQVEYLEEIARAWLAAGVVDEDRGVPGRLVTGRLRAHPLDVVLGAVDREVLPGPDAPMAALWEPIVARLVR